MISVEIIPILQDNYCYLLNQGDDVIVIDPGHADPVITALQRRSLTVNKILLTHHHADHIAGASHIKKLYGSKIYAPEKEKERIGNIDVPLKEGDVFSIGSEPCHVMETPGHTAGHIVYHCPVSKLLFSGDTLFSLGCGRLFEGTAGQMHESLNKIKNLPDETLVYCGHEYTRDNAAFLLSLDPTNQALKIKINDIEKSLSKKIPTIPVTLGEEKSLNAFLQCETAGALQMLRRLKDQH